MHLHVQTTEHTFWDLGETSCELKALRLKLVSHNMMMNNNMQNLYYFISINFISMYSEEQ